MKVLITGGTGLIGKEISKQLLEKNHEVVYLSRTPRKNNLGIDEFAWDVDRGTYDSAAFEGIDTIVNLAGASLSRRWTPEYKNEILRSRVDGTRLLYKAVQKENSKIKTLLSASAVGYYPHDMEKTYSEQDPPGTDFLSMVTQKWEQEAQHFKTLGINTIRCRIGVVLSNDGGALPVMSQPIKLGFGAALGDGQQWMSWIHIRDAAGIMVYLLENDLSGVFNVVGPSPVTNEVFTKKLASTLHRPLWLPKAPSIALKLLLGEMSAAALSSNKVSNKKVESTGYKYKFPELDMALKDLLD